MKIIDLWVHTKSASCNTNNCYHTYNTHTVYVFLFGFKWEVLKWDHNKVYFHNDNEPPKYNGKH